MRTEQTTQMATELELNVSSDGSVDETAEDNISSVVMALRTIFIILVSVFTMVSNPFCIWVILRTPTLSDSAKVFMIALAAADFAVGVIDAFSVVPAATGVWFWGGILCQATSALVTMFCLASVSCLMCLSIDRMIAVTKSLHYPNIMTQRRAVAITVGVWTASVAIIGGSWHVSPPVEYSNFSVTCAWQWGAKHVPFASVMSTCFFILPSSVLSIMYWIMFNISRKHTRRIANLAPKVATAGEEETQPRARALSAPANWVHAQEGNPAPPQQGDRKAIKMFCVITIAFTIAWLPYSVSILYSSIQSEPLASVVGFLVTWLALSNSWFNVVIYVCMNRALRETAFRLIKKKKWCLHSPPRCCSRTRPVAQAVPPDQPA